MSLFKKLELFLFSPLVLISFAYFTYLVSAVPNFDRLNHLFLAIPSFYLAIKFYLMRKEGLKQKQ